MNTSQRINVYSLKVYFKLCKYCKQDQTLVEVRIGEMYLSLENNRLAEAVTLYKARKKKKLRAKTAVENADQKPRSMTV